MILETERLVLRPLGVGDLETTHTYAGDTETTKYMIYFPSKTLADTERFLADAAFEWEKDRPAFYEFAVTLDGAHIGGVTLKPDGQNRQGELGWVLNRDYWGQGYASEAIAAVIQFAFQKRKLKKLVAYCDSRNQASIRLMGKIGLRLESSEGVRRYADARGTSGEHRYSLSIDEEDLSMDRGGREMDEKAKKYVDLFRRVKICSAGTVDAQGKVHSRIINVLMVDARGMFLVASRGKPFYKQMLESGQVALAASVQPNQSLKFDGKVKLAGRAELDEIFVQNPGLGEVYPGETRYILDAFWVYEGCGEWFDLRYHPITRETFAYGGAQEEHNGFEITKGCTECDLCRELCPQGCIEKGSPYHIVWMHCLQCGRCIENCPADAIVRLHP
ncbi:GNAT family N-acetyltransferase [Ruminococcaceae bacterium OttesenSCG-928-I18]|nr:GNAT family N-acetyltransferase [Ruminococcaceae bacterium OttesenSCG-928-I18]